VPLRALALAFAVAAPSQPAPNDTPVQLGVTLRLTHRAQLDALRQAQQDPKSPEYRHFLTPQEFGERFGQPEAVYQQAVRWLSAAGLDVQTAPNRSFLTAKGTAGQVEALLGIQLVRVEGKPAAVHVPVGTPRLPPALAPVVLDISGLDTRIRFHHHLNDTYGYQDMGPQDLRRFYGIQPLLDRGFMGQGQKLVVLSTAESDGNGPSIPAIQYYYSNVSDATAQLVVHQVTPGTNDVDPTPGGGVEFELDMEMQSVASPGADSITLEVSPASTVFTVGAEDIVNNLPDTTATSVSLGLCEEAEQQEDPTEMAAMEQAVAQGLAEGQTWSAASGDNGSDDCQDSGNPVGQSVDFPATLPEEVAMGGSELNPTPWDADGALTQYFQETVWNDGANGGAGGGGISTIYPTPSYQELIGRAPDGGRVVPDLSLIAGLPGVAIDDGVPGPLEPVEGTSVASPLSAGIFALIASRIGCRLGDVHPALYALGAAQTADAGAGVYHDIVTGNNDLDGVPGYNAGPGFDPASGWGSLNVTALADAWPSCFIADGGVDAGVAYTSFDGGPAYTQCGAIGCATAGCTTLPEGPSTCEANCPQDDAGSCGSGQVCGVTGQTVYAVDGGTGSCVPGCLTNADCASQAGTVCSTCQEICVPAGNPSSAIGDGCAADTDCPSGDFCETGRRFDGGYCSAYCIPPSVGPSSPACSCPAGSPCEVISTADEGYGQCIEACDTPGQPCAARPGYLCQPLSDGNPGACLPACRVSSFSGDSCALLDGTGYTCDTTTGYCLSPVTGTSGGTTGAGTTGGAGTTSGGTTGGQGTTGGSSTGGTTGAPAGTTGGAGASGGSTPDAGTGAGKSGCGCGATGSAGEGLWLLAGLAALALRRRRFA